MTVSTVALEALIVSVVGAWYLIAVPESSAVDAASGLPAGGYSRFLGAAGLVLGLFLVLAAVLIARGRTWPIGLAVAWQPFQAVTGFTLWGEPGRTPPIALLSVALIVVAIAAIVLLVATLRAVGRPAP